MQDSAIVPQELATTALKRNYGVELLRIVSMFLVCMLHVLGQGGILQSASPQSTHYYLAWLLETAAYCAVNCYALISGFVGVNSKFKLANLVYLWLQVAVYSLGIMAIFMLAKWEPYSGTTLLHSFLPVTFESYWYISAYFGMFLLIPLFNAALKNIPQKPMLCLLLLLLAVIVVFGKLNSNLFQLNRGYSVLWLSVLYLVGGYMRKYQPLAKVKNRWLVVIWLGAILLSFLVKVAIEEIAIAAGKNASGNFLISYLSPTIVIVAIAMLELFSRIPFRKKPKVLAAMASASLGVYLIHVHPLMWQRLANVFAKYTSYHPILMVLAAIGTAAALYLGCTIIDYARLKLFDLLHIKQLLTNVEIKIRSRLFEPKKEAEQTEPTTSEQKPDLGEARQEPTEDRPSQNKHPK